MPLPHFLLLIALVVIAAGATIWVASSVGVSWAAVTLVVLIGAALVRLLARVE
jgi:hypothetical protein